MLLLLIPLFYAACADNEGIVAQGITRIKNGINLLEEKMKALEATELNIMNELDADNQDLTHVGLSSDRNKARQKVREERISLRKIARTKRLVLSKMYKILRVLSPLEQSRVIRQLNLLNRLHVNHLALLGVDEARLAFSNSYLSSPQVDQFQHEGMIVQANDMGDYLMKTNDADPIEVQKKKLEDVEKEMQRLNRKFEETPFLKNAMIKRSSEQYNKLLEEMVVKIEQAVGHKAKESYELAKKIDDNVEKLEMNMDLMTEKKRTETLKQIRLMKKQREKMNNGVNEYRATLNKMMKKLKRSSLAVVKAAKKVERTNKICSKGVSEKQVVKRGIDEVVDKIAKKAGKMIDTNIKKNEVKNVDLKNIVRTAPKTQNATQTVQNNKKEEKKVKKTIEQIIKETACDEMKKIRNENLMKMKQMGKKEQQREVIKEVKRELSVDVSKAGIEKSLKKAKEAVKKVDKMTELFKEMAASKEMIEEEVNTALEI
ncbi:hypothetical protein EIN_309600 [Entamoeba invadens IP1]|uniref:Uncharacterized protein n=1 Tax=Entamoeba invadens IP1 TaxID=370355 RepID=A0A0A1TWB8_ENTIV|nr:hypothetical protein EIN_309600 [Entamoeba invadens IP1]ELP84957.1 hypothetical protein EIN_309600 [Entamoeba invadens IP1]|eukprot:XP_004184303.1 hypothetical protein EIN_309600 [Entamoeba invadens IP1]